MQRGVGLTVTLRLRLGAHDAHYAGGVVDGARILSLFGDVATELLIRLDGDEGSFRAYEVVEFVSPVRSGDFLEVTGVVTKVGATTRAMAFEARKIICLSLDPMLAPSAADALEEPAVVARALGTCVVPQALQRRPRIVLPALSAPPPDVAQLPEPRPVITPAPRVIVTPANTEVAITAAIAGTDAGELADEAARCRDAGASVVHLRPAGERELLADAVAAIATKTDLVIQISTGVVGLGVEQRAELLSSRPEMATLTCGTVNVGDEVLLAPRPLVRALAARIRGAGCAVVLECHDAGHVEEGIALAAEGLLSEPLHFQFVLGVPGGIGARPDALQFLAAQIPAGATWGVAAVGRHQRPVVEHGIRLGGHVRVGLEGSAEMSKGVLAEGCAPLVARAAEFARSVGRVVVEPARARQLLGLTG